MRPVPVLAALFLIATSVCVHADNATDLARSAGSPLDLQRFVETHSAFDWAPLWTSLKLTDDTGLPACELSPNGASDCSSELIRVLDPEQTIVRLQHRPSGFEVYLRFVPEPARSGVSRWHFTGHYQPHVKYFTPTHRTLKFGKHSFLAITEQGASGLGLSTEVETWIDLTQPRLQPVFWYTTEGNLQPFPEGISREVHGAVSVLTAEPVESIKVVYSIDFALEDPSGMKLPLGGRQDQAVYLRHLAEQEFTFDEKLSGVPLKRITNLYLDLDSEISDEDFLKYNFASLKKIAAGPESLPKRWLRQFLIHCSETSEKLQLRRALRRQVSAPRAN